MTNKHQQQKRALHALFILLLSVVGMTKLQAQNITFADAEVKSICVANWDTNSDGELSYAEATVVTSLGGVFRNNSSITSFDELQYFTGLSSIESQAFYYCTGLTSIEIPSSVTSIGGNAFLNCTGLTSIEIPSSVTSIGGNAFRNCTGLTSIEIPISVTSIGDYAFSGCIGLTSIEIPNSVTSIGDYAFSGCSGLEQIIVDAGNTAYDSRDNCNAIINSSTNELVAGCKDTVIPNTVTSIGRLAFDGCTGLTSIEIPNSVTSIYNYAFRDCTNLTSIEIPNSVTLISNYAFSGCSGLEQIIVDAGNTIFDSRGNCNAIIKSSTNMLIIGCKNTVIPNSVTFIGGYAFYGCTGLTSMQIPNSVTFIYEYAFSKCTGLTSIEISNSVTYISSGAFSDCINLTSIEIPNSVTYIRDYAFFRCSGITSVVIDNDVDIGQYAFGDCASLASITVYAGRPPYLRGNAFHNVDKSIPVYVPCGSLEAYQTATGWSDFTNIQESCPQTVTLSEDWNWFSTYIEAEDLLQQLETALGENGIQIKNDSISTEYDSEWG